MAELRLRVNGCEHVADAPVGTSRARLLRGELGLTGTKVACDEGRCGTRTVRAATPLPRTARELTVAPAGR